MPVYRFQVPAVIMFDVRAESPEAAVTAAEQIRINNKDGGWDVDLEPADCTSNHEGRAYLDEQAARAHALTTDDIVHEYEELSHDL